MNIIKKIRPIHLLIIFVILNLVIGIIITPNFGRSTDEQHELRTAQVAFNIYVGNFTEIPAETYANLRHDRLYGTASTALVSFIEYFLFPNFDHSTNQVAHYIYFMFFQAAALGIFLLARYFFDDWISLAAALLFATQPLLFGHAFVNPKDIPFLTTFLFTVVIGFIMVDRWSHEEADDDNSNAQVTSKKEYRIKKRLLLILFISLFLLLWCSPWLTDLALNLVEYGYTTAESTFIGRIFTFLTTYGSLEGYLYYTQISLIHVYRWTAFGTPVFLIIGFFVAQRFRLFGKKIDLLMLLAAAVWGVAISTRVVGIAAGGLIGLYAMMKFRYKALFPLAVYTLTASLVSYITWPIVWIEGVKAYIDSLVLMSNFPWPGQVLFEGQLYNPTELPINFVPKLMMLQFTEPLVILALAGLAISAVNLYKKKKTTDIPKLAVVLAWFFVPLLYIIIAHPTIYSNFRHFFFIIPPLFVLAGFALQLISSYIPQRGLLLAICLALIVPGMFGIIQSHPFEYIYYNAFAGGIEGASGQYELDYWNISYKDVMDYVNENMPSRTRFLVWKDNTAGEVYAEYNYFFTAHDAVEEADYQNYDYMIIPAIQLDEQPFFASLPVIFSVEVDNTSLMMILKIEADEELSP